MHYFENARGSDINVGHMCHVTEEEDFLTIYRQASAFKNLKIGALAALLSEICVVAVLSFRS